MTSIVLGASRRGLDQALKTLRWPRPCGRWASGHGPRLAHFSKFRRLHLSDKVSGRTTRQFRRTTVVGKVSNTMEIDFGRDTGYGFNITDESGRPIASFVFKTQQEGLAASIQARLLIENALSSHS